MKCLIAVAVLASTAAADELAISQRLADTGAGFAVATTTWNVDHLQLGLAGEAHVYGPLRAVVGVSEVIGERPRPGIGAAVQITASSAAYLRYKAEGFSEPEGELEAMYAFGRDLGGVYLGCDVAYGQDPEGNERDGELATTAQLAVAPELYTGLTARYRDALGSTKEPIVRDGLAGAASTWMVGRFALGGVVGVAMVETRDARRVGAGATLALGATF